MNLMESLGYFIYYYFLIYYVYDVLLIFLSPNSLYPFQREINSILFYSIFCSGSLEVVPMVASTHPRTLIRKGKLRPEHVTRLVMQSLSGTNLCCLLENKFFLSRD